MVDERAVTAMLGKEGIPFLKKLVKQVKRDPEFLNSQGTRVSREVEKILSHGGIHWHREIFEREWQEIVKEAMARLGQNDR